MNWFLKNCRAQLGSKLPKLVVIGNESCDLDSAVCSIALAFHLSKCPSFLEAVPDHDRVLPVLNVVREELPLKTEVVHFLRVNHIDTGALICRDELLELQDPAASATRFVLVDHHMSRYRNHVIAVIDHRPVDASFSMPDGGVFQCIEQVGSCASLVTQLVQRSKRLEEKSSDNSEILNLLYGAIILDTVNFSQQADRARPLDHEMAGLIEQYLGIDEPAQHRQKLFDDLVKARSDVSSLDSLQILSKDLKIVSQNGRTVAIPGYPILVQDYLQLADAEVSIKRFAEKTGSNVVVLMGMKVNIEDGSVRRDLGIISIDDSALSERIVGKLRSNMEPNFELKQHCHTQFLGGVFFEQCNVRATRKLLLPLVMDVLSASA